MFFESQHSLNGNEFVLSEEASLSFPIHIHRSFEYFEQIKGSTVVFIGNKRYHFREGESVLIFPLQPHSYSSKNNGLMRLCIFSPEMVAEFYKSNESRIPADNKFVCTLSNKLSLDNVFYKKSLAYFICAEFEKGRKYIEPSDKSENKLLVDLLLFADENYCNSCLLRDAAVKIGYDYAYISKFFKRRVGISFRQYVNNLRIKESKSLLRSGKSIEQILESCGFSSLRSFDRVFRKETGITPSDYRKNIRNDM